MEIEITPGADNIFSYPRQGNPTRQAVCDFSISHCLPHTSRGIWRHISYSKILCRRVYELFPYDQGK